MSIEYYFEYNEDKSRFLLETRGLSFEEAIEKILEGKVLDTIKHPNSLQYPNQEIFVVEIDNYCYLVPHVITGNKIFLKTIIPSRKTTKHYLKGMSHEKH